MALTMTLEEALAGGDAFTIRAVAQRDAERAYRKGYIEGVSDYEAQLRYALDTGPGSSPVGWLRFLDDAKLVRAVLETQWDDLRIVRVADGEDVTPA